MVSISFQTVTHTSYRAIDDFTSTATHVTTASTEIYPPHYDSHPTDWKVWANVFVDVVIDMPFTCDSIKETSELYSRIDLPSTANPDIAGIGIVLAFLIAAISVLLLALTAYTGGFLPGPFVRRIDRAVFCTNSRNQHSRWRKIIENVTLSLSDQQLVTGLAILVAGFCERLSSDNMATYHWFVIVYLAWLSSAVHIASLTLLRDFFNERPALRNLRFAGMLALLALLAAAMWPLRYVNSLEPNVFRVPIKCFWRLSGQSYGYKDIEVDWLLSFVMLFGAYIWKLSQLFATSRSSIRKWAVAKPQAAMERLMRRSVLSRRSRWITWPAYHSLAFCYIAYVVYAEVAESFVACIIYLCMALPWGIANIFHARSEMSKSVLADETRLTFGQLVPLFLLVLPLMLVFELRAGAKRTAIEGPGAIHSLATTGLLRPSKAVYENFKSALNLSEPSTAGHKLDAGINTQPDPIIDHLMSSKALRGVIRSFVVSLIPFGVAVTALTAITGGSARSAALQFGGPIVVCHVPLALLLVMPFSRRMR